MVTIDKSNSEQELTNSEESPTRKVIFIVGSVIVTFTLIAGGVYFFLADPLDLGFTTLFRKEETAVSVEPSVTESTGVAISIPPEIESNQFGFLAGHFSPDEPIIESGAAWIRPHSGPFLWDSTQSEEGSGYNFEAIDNIVKSSQDFDYAILATVWPFAEWDQENRADAEDCEVPDTDHFLPMDIDKDDEKFDDKFEDMDEKIKDDIPDSNYISKHRCNPNDWDAYAEWLGAMVERYDGDGVEDMSGLKIPIKYWEVAEHDYN